MLKRLVENWLTSLSERKDLDIPFRLLLEAEGHVAIAHATVHGPMELGKDIISWHPQQKQFFFFQLKAGDATLSDWNEMERQIRQLVEVPYVHPNYTIGDPYKPIWVCTGQLQESVRLSLGLQNEDLRRLGKPPVEVWDRNQLIEKFVAAFFTLPFVSDTFTVDFLRRWSHTSEYLTDEDELRVFFSRTLFALPAAKPREMKHHLATYALVVAQLSQRYLSLDDAYSAIDCAILGAIQLYDFIENQRIAERMYHASLQIVQESIRFLLQTFVEDCEADQKQIEELFDDSIGFTEIFELPLRVHSMASKLGLSLLLKALDGKDFSKESQLLQLVISHHPTFCHLISERQMGTWWVALIALLRAGQREQAAECVEQTFDWLMQCHGKEQIGLPDPYQPYRYAVNHQMRIETDNMRLFNMNGQSYMLPMLLKLLCYLAKREVVAKSWNVLSRMQLREYFPANVQDLLAYRPKTGKMKLSGFPVTGSWSALQRQYTERLTGDMALFAQKHPESLLMLALAYPWHTQWRELERYL